jgi:hypothetical protein
MIGVFARNLVKSVDKRLDVEYRARVLTSFDSSIAGLAPRASLKVLNSSFLNTSKSLSDREIDPKMTIS